MHKTTRLGFWVLATVFTLNIAACGGSPTDRAFADRAGEGVPLSPVESFFPGGHSMEEILEQSDLVFIGTVADYVEGAYIESADEEDPDKAVIVHDGVVFNVDELLKGEDVSEATILTPVLIQEASGELRHNLSDGRIMGLANAASKRNENAKGGLSVLVFASEGITDGNYYLYGDFPTASVVGQEVDRGQADNGRKWTISEIQELAAR